MRAYVACVGLIVLAGCFALVIAPDEVTMQSPFPSGRPTIVIDPGHGGNDEGAKWHGVLEKTLTLDVSFRLERVLNERGFRTVLTRTDDHYVALSDRVAVANALDGPVLFVSVHFNQGSSGSINGVETFYANSKTPPPANWTWVGFFNRPEQLDSGENLAADVQLAVVNKTGARNRGIRPRDLYVTRNTRVPAILIEGGFITNRMESQLLSGDEYANRLAEGIAEGVETWLQSQPKSPPSRLAQQ